MAVPEVNKKLLEGLEALGFPLARATRALHYSGNVSLEAAVNWVIDHENDSDIDQMPLVPLNIEIESPEPGDITEEMKIKAQELRNQARQKKEENNLERETEKDRVGADEKLLDAKQIEAEIERKRIIASRKADKEEERRARERIRRKLEQDKAERRRSLGLPLENPAPVKPSSLLQEKKNFLPLKSTTKAEHLRECLRSLRRNYKDDDARVKRAFQTLLIYVGNVVKNPNEGRFRKIRFSNPNFQDRVASLKGGVEFLELCGFERIDGGEFLFLPREKVDMAVLNSAGAVLKSGLTNPFFGLL